LVLTVFVSGDNLTRLLDGFPLICLLVETAQIVEGFLITLPAFYKILFEISIPLQNNNVLFSVFYVHDWVQRG
jgi:hypothetical protein